MIVTGDYRDNLLTGTESDDFLFGFGGNDTFISALGNDSLHGGVGDDIFIVAPQCGGVTCFINGGRGDDVLYLAREPLSMEYQKGLLVIDYDYDMTIIVKNVEIVEGWEQG